MNDNTPPKQQRGFATLSPERRAEISSLGGRSVPAEKRAFSKDHYLASAAGRKGGMKSRKTVFMESAR